MRDEYVIYYNFKKKEDIMEQNKEHKIKRILRLFENNPDAFFTASKINQTLGLPVGYNHWPTHALLTELKERGYLEQEKGRGFKYILTKENMVERDLDYIDMVIKDTLESARLEILENLKDAFQNKITKKNS